jgi:alkylhydroperoxidase family enzyme
MSSQGRSAGDLTDHQAKFLALELLRRGEVNGEEQLTAAFALAREIAGSKGHVEDTTWKTALEAGWSEPQLVEVFADTVRTIFTNYFNHLADTEQDVPAAPEL